MIDLTWWGHSTVSIRDSGVHLVTDPLLTDRVAHLTRRRGRAPDQLSPDAVLISHLHHDHLHLPSLRRLAPGTRVVVPVGGGGLITRLGLVAREVAPGDEVVVGGVSVRAVRAVHDGRRHPGSSWWGPALGYVVHGSLRTWFAGDTGPAELLGQDVGAVDVALVPVGGWGPVSRGSTTGQHLGPRDAAAVTVSVGASLAVPIHYGTMWPSGLRAKGHRLFLSPGAEFARELGALGTRAQARVMHPGEQYQWAPPAVS